MAEPAPAALPDLSIRQLEYLVAVSESRTWAEAASTLGVSGSGLSQGMSELERRLGIALFDREGRRRVLRPGTEPVVDHARQVLALTGDLARWAARTRTADLGQLRIGMIDAAAVHHYPDVLRRFRTDHPDLEIRLQVGPSAGLLEDLAAGRIDVAVCVAPDPAPPGIGVRQLLREELAVYRPGGGRAGPPAGWGPWVLFPQGSHTRTVIESELRAIGAPVEVIAESNQPDVLAEMVNLELGWTVLPTVQAETGLRPLRRARTLTTRSLVVATRATTAPDPAVGALVAVLSEAALTA
ncbi:MAG: LysR family transcriptional regulator [Acidimicrobiales bacterium]